MATKTLEETIQSKFQAMQAEAHLYQDRDFQGMAVQVAVAKGRVRLAAKLALAKETAKVENKIAQEQASLINAMDPAERESLRAARATLQGLKSESHIQVSGQAAETETSIPVVQ